MKSNVQVVMPRLLTLKDAAQYLGMGVWKLRRMVWGGQFKYVQTAKGGPMLLDRVELDHWIDVNQQKF